MHENMTLLEYVSYLIFYLLYDLFLVCLMLEITHVLLFQAYGLWREGKGVEFVDPSLDDTKSTCKIMRCMQVALLCVQENSGDRPSMLEVDSLLKNEGAVIDTPKMPAFSVQKRGDEEETSHSRIKFCSINDVTISELAPR